MPKPASTRSAYKMLTCIYLCRTLLFFAPYADFFEKKSENKDWEMTDEEEDILANYIELDSLMQVIYHAKETEPGS